MSKITIFPSVRETSSGHFITIETALQRIKNNPKQHDLIQRIRNSTDKAQRDELKRTLPAYCFSGMFTRKNTASIQQHSGLICLDFDNETRENILRAGGEYIYACFLSPSGKGYKVLVRIPPSIEDHTNYFLSLKDHFNLPTFDIKVKNISTACYDTEDPDIYINPDAPVYLKMNYTESFKSFTQIPAGLLMTNSSRIIDKLQKWIDRTDSFTAGRNNYIHKFACALNRYGITYVEALRYLQQFAQPDFSSEEIERTVKSAYNLNQSEHKTEFFKDAEPLYAVQQWKRQQLPLQDIKSQLITNYQITGQQADDIITEASNAPASDIFWYERKTKMGIMYHVDKTALRKIYERYAIRRYKINSKTWMMVQIDGCKVREIVIDEMKDIIRRHFDSLPVTINNTPKHIIQNQLEDRLDENFLRPDKLAWLEDYQIKFNRDDLNTAYFYYRNCMLKVTADNIEVCDYTTTMDSYIWADQIIDRDFELLPKDQIPYSEYWDFIRLISTGDQMTEENIRNFDSICNTIGFLLHGYKDKSNPKAVIITDEIISDTAQGGVGKGIFIQGISHIKRTVKFDGKLWSWTKPFLYQRVTLATQVLAWEDVLKNFNFEKLFSLITDGIEIEKKNKDSYYIDYADAPKVMITSNYVISGHGDSQERRKHEIELKRFFHKDYKPVQYFKHNLFDGWDAKQWQLFDNFMMYCVAQYLDVGLLPSTNNTLRYKKLINTVPEEVMQWIKEFVIVGVEYKLTDIVDQIRSAFQEHQKTMHRIIMQWIIDTFKFMNRNVTKKTSRDGVYFTVG